MDRYRLRENSDHFLERAGSERIAPSLEPESQMRLRAVEQARRVQAESVATGTAARHNTTRVWPPEPPRDARGRKLRAGMLGLYSVPGYPHLHVLECVVWRAPQELSASDCQAHCLTDECSDGVADAVFYLSDDGDTLIGWESEAPDMDPPVRVAFVLVSLKIPSTVRILRQRIRVTQCHGSLPERLLRLIWIE